MKPILFSTLMVQAVLDGTKNQTRRILKAPEDWQFKSLLQSAKPKIGLQAFGTLGDLDGLYGIKAAYIPGDIIWVREEHYVLGHWIKNGTTKTGRQKWKFVNDNMRPVLYSDCKPAHYKISRDKHRPDLPYFYKRNARTMFREYARLFLRVTNVRVERLQAISDIDALNEGTPDEYYDMAEHYHIGGSPLRGVTVERCSFAMLWESINGPGSWDANPWVWVYDFERCEKPIN